MKRPNKAKSLLSFVNHTVINGQNVTPPAREWIRQIRRRLITCALLVPARINAGDVLIDGQHRLEAVSKFIAKKKRVGRQKKRGKKKAQHP